MRDMPRRIKIHHNHVGIANNLWVEIDMIRPDSDTTYVALTYECTHFCENPHLGHCCLCRGVSVPCFICVP